MEIDEFIGSLAWNKRMELLRRAKNWTQQQAAEKCSTNQKVYWSWENGRNYPRKRSRIFIARAFETKIEDIFPMKFAKD